MHVTPFSAATILVLAIASPLHAQGIEVFGGYSVNADYVQNRPAILVVDQKVSSASKSMYPVIPIHSHRALRRTANRTAPLGGVPAAPA